MLHKEIAPVYIEIARIALSQVIFQVEPPNAVVYSHQQASPVVDHHRRNQLVRTFLIAVELVLRLVDDKEAAIGSTNHANTVEVDNIANSVGAASHKPAFVKQEELTASKLPQRVRGRNPPFFPIHL